MLSDKNIFLNLDIDTKQQVLQFIAKKAVELNICENEEGLLSDLNKREEEYSTGLQDGFAIPHAKSQYIKEPTILFLKTNKGIEWETMDDKDVNYIFALLVPKENEDNIHLKMISKLTVGLLEDDFKEYIISCNNEKELEQYLMNFMKEEE